MASYTCALCFDDKLDIPISVNCSVIFSSVKVTSMATFSTGVFNVGPRRTVVKD